jgi:hypothetical protein
MHESSTDRLTRPTCIDLLQDSFSRCDCFRDDGFERRRMPSPIQCSQIPSSQNRGSDQQNALTSLVHRDKVSRSPFVRYPLQNTP